jgi:hypothetical protein
MESFDAINATTGAVPLFHGEPAAEPLHLAGTVPASHENLAAGSRPSAAGQAERSTIHPDRDDLEWHYCRSGRAG